MGTLIAIGIGIAFVATFAWLTVRARRRPADPEPATGTADDGLSWPDPSTRPRF
jgi:hypothetical protein